jgi:hypothetical protein
MRAAARLNVSNEGAMRAQILAVLEELCRDATLQEVREWYLDSLTESYHAHGPATGGLE